MYQTGRLFYRVKNAIGTGLLLFLLSAHSHAGTAEKPGPVVVTIKPLYSLVAHLSDGIETPVLLMQQIQSPHHYNMRPSERALLAKARMIIWTGPPMESFLNKLIQQQSISAIAVSAMQARNLKLLGKRKKHAHHEDHTESGHSQESHTIDPHIWLSADNAIAISRHITGALISHDPENAAAYRKNLEQLVIKIEQTKEHIKSVLNNSTAPFLAFHDAFQYFEDEYRLNYIDSISYDEETGVSLKHLRRIKADIQKNNIQCLVYQAPKPAIVKSLEKQSSIKAVALDPLGLNVNDDKNAWFEIMQQLTTDFSYCLNP